MYKIFQEDMSVESWPKLDSKQSDGPNTTSNAETMSIVLTLWKKYNSPEVSKFVEALLGSISFFERRFKP